MMSDRIIATKCPHWQGNRSIYNAWTNIRGECEHCKKKIYLTLEIQNND